MFSWLRGPTPLEKALAREDYKKAVELLDESLESETKPMEVRALQQTKAELLGKLGEKEPAIEILRQLMNDYSKDRMHTKAIAIHKLMCHIDIHVAGRILDDVAKQALDDIKPIELLPVGGDEALPGHVTATVAHTPLFGDLSSDEVQALIGGLTLQAMEPGDIICVENEPGDSLFILTEGEVKVFVRGSSGRTTKIREMESGCFFGEVSIVYGKARTATITCKTRCELLELDKERLGKISETHPNVRKVLKEFCDNRLESPEEKKGREGQDK